jgi:hypothetical protein
MPEMPANQPLGQQFVKPGIVSRNTTSVSIVITCNLPSLHEMNVIYSMTQNIPLVTQLVKKILCSYETKKVHHHVQKSPSLDTILSQLNPLHIISV